MKEVSVIIPTHNRCYILKRTIKSYLANQAVHEIVIVNDNSTDDTETWLLELAHTETRLRYISNNQNLGAPASRNRGIESASKDTKFLFFGEDDAFLKEGAIDELVKLLEEENADIIGGRISPVSDVSYPSAKNEYIDGKKPINLNIMRANFQVNPEENLEVPFLHALFLARKWVFEKASFDPHYFGNAYREETDFCLEAVKNGARIIFTPFITIYHVEAPSGGQRRIKKLDYELAVLKNNWYFLNKHHSFLRKRYKIITPKVGFQVILVSRRIYLIIKYFLKKVMEAMGSNY